MNSSILFAVLGLAVFQSLAASIPNYFERYPTTRTQLDTNQIQAELGKLVSKETAIFGPDDDRYDNATSRWNTFAVPQIKVVISPGQESDVSTIVKYCNDNSIDFLTINRNHGNSQSLGSFNGVQINMASLRGIEIQPSGKSAWFQGGVYDGQVMRYLWDRGYVTTTGSCDCVGMMGPGLGGGHGRHEGLYGMISDNILQLNVVLADGRAIRVNNTSSNYSDLLWAMKGAGHNFGIVTSFELNIFPRGPDTWHYQNFIWQGDKLEAIFNALNNLHDNGNTPVNMTLNFGSFLMNTTISDKEPVIFWTFAYRGNAQEATEYLAPFTKIESVYQESGDVSYPEISVAQQTDENAFICQDGHTRLTATAGLQVYNLTAERQIFDSFTKCITSNPELAAGGNVLHEGYSTKAVQAQNPADSAYPFRDDHHLMLVQIIVSDPSLEPAGWEWAKEVRDFWNNGQPTRPADAYVNYANGFEPVEQMYGHEAWRLQRLRELKAKYDPSNRFRYYNPIIGGEKDGPI
ncbi:FAD-binding domain-containing protein [Colletotrichum somersetense]|nr:FAD-binding domain-containing protein [Colletotrichum somersetense]